MCVAIVLVLLEVTACLLRYDCFVVSDYVVWVLWNYWIYLLFGWLVGLFGVYLLDCFVLVSLFNSVDNLLL